MRPPFRTPKDAPPPLVAEVTRTVRFEEVDPLGVVWHGRYASWFEDARVLLGDTYGVGYLDNMKNGVATPLKEFHVDYKRPLTYPETYTIRAELHYSEAARMNYLFTILDADGVVCTTGWSVQLFVDLQENLLMVLPPFYADFLARWKNRILVES